MSRITKSWYVGRFCTIEVGRAPAAKWFWLALNPVLSFHVDICGWGFTLWYYHKAEAARIPSPHSAP